MKVKINNFIVSDFDAPVYKFFGYSVTSPKDVTVSLEKSKGEKAEVEIGTCYGGDVWAASDIYTALKAHEGGCAITITGIAASAASVIAMAGHCKMSPTAQMMIHNAQLYAEGDFHDMDKASEIAKTANMSIVGAYMLKTGMTDKEMLAVMDKESWFTAQQAVDMKLVDEIMFTDGSVRMAASFGMSPLPATVIEKTRAMLAERGKKDEQPQAPEAEESPAAAEASEKDPPEATPAVENNLATEIDKMKLALQAQM